MPTELQSTAEGLFRLLGPGAIFVIGCVALWRLVFTPRKVKSADGREVSKSALLVPGYEHDRTLEEMELLRIARDRREQEIQAEADRRIAEWRGLRDEEKARASESDERLRAMDAYLTRFDGVLEDMLKLLTELADRARRTDV